MRIPQLEGRRLMPISSEPSTLAKFYLQSDLANLRLMQRQLYTRSTTKASMRGNSIDITIIVIWSLVTGSAKLGVIPGGGGRDGISL